MFKPAVPKWQNCKWNELTGGGRLNDWSIVLFINIAMKYHLVGCYNKVDSFYWVPVLFHKTYVLKTYDAQMITIIIMLIK